MKFALPLSLLAVALCSNAAAQQTAAPTLQKAVTPQHAGTFHPATGFTSGHSPRWSIGYTVNNAIMSNYFMLSPGPDHEWIDNNILEDLDGTGEEWVFQLDYTYCSSDPNPNGVSEIITIYDESVYCLGPTNWPVADCAYQFSGLPGGVGGALACWSVEVELTGVECTLTDGHGGHAGWGQQWDNPYTGPWLAYGGTGQTPTFTWFDHSQPSGSAFQGCQFINAGRATGFAMGMWSDDSHGKIFRITSDDTPGGWMTFNIVHASPNTQVATFYAFGYGNQTVFNPFTGNVVQTSLAADGFTFVELEFSDSNGSRSFTRWVPYQAAGLVRLQSVDTLLDWSSTVLIL